MVGMYSFQSCSNLESLDTSNVKKVGGGGVWAHFAFASCTKLDRLVFKSLTSAIQGGQVFRDSGERYIIFDVDLVVIKGTGEFSATRTSLPIYVRDNLVNDYKALDSGHNCLPISQFSTDFPGETY
jgi:hypothetical protein